ncbi:SDR family NAD(P)-dependent oxidoreductase [Streptomyces microflavus]|uniref:3-oxoacyl-ACP reductase n=1 Tax=Streptomyces microflavus TaxID=1919 RepID=A0A7J0D277_STRMI|nr:MULTISPECIES: SDR family oxidoreductase [Streptomyces]MDX2978879.1 SDR family oxidoreductase [Streptomyces sp. NRRL_B-2249]GFN08284.1 3-oxoacyl-ACP reductase [Streptomyces microflavus]GGX71563.1 3-oxoacyl-ACP reductase [Streptomyces microflavus]
MSSTTVTAPAPRAALVTGGSRGIGAATALRLAEAGADVAITYVQDEEGARAVVAKIEGAGRRGVALRCDAADADGAAGAVHGAADALGRLDVLVNNAGIGVLGPIAALSDAEVERVLAVNVRAVFLACRAAADRLADGGRIISVGTALSRYTGGPGSTLYTMSKSALAGLTRPLARELGPRRITVNLIQPGPVDTDLNPAGGPFAEGQRAATALGRFGTADEVASLVAYLASADAAFITGTEVVVDGGHAA